MNGKPIPYTIQVGDTLYSISEKILKGVLWEKDPKTGNFNVLPDQKKRDIAPTREEINRVIDLIKTENPGMTDAIQAGKKISIPSQEDALIAAGLKSAPEQKPELSVKTPHITDDPIITGAKDKDTKNQRNQEKEKQKETKKENAQVTKQNPAPQEQAPANKSQSWPEGVPLEQEKNKKKNPDKTNVQIVQAETAKPDTAKTEAKPEAAPGDKKFDFKLNRNFTRDFDFSDNGSIMSKLADVKAPLLGQSALYAGANILYGTPRLNAYMDTKAGRLGIHNGLEGSALPDYARMDGANFQGGLTAYYPETAAHLNPSLTNLIGLRTPLKDTEFLGGELTDTYINAGVRNGFSPVANITTTYRNGDADISASATYQEKNIRADLGFGVPVIDRDRFSMTPAVMHTSRFDADGYAHLSTAALNLKTVLKASDKLAFSISAAPYAQYGSDGLNYGARGAATTEVPFAIKGETTEDKRTEFKANLGLICNLDKNTGLTYGPVFGVNLDSIKP